MSEFGGLWKHENNQHALVPPKTECGCPSGGGIKHGHIRYPSYGGTQKERIQYPAKISEFLETFFPLDSLVLGGFL